MLADEIQWPSSPSESTVITGVVRGKGLKADRLVTVGDWGTFQIEKITAAPLATKKKRDGDMAMDEANSEEVLETPGEDQEDTAELAPEEARMDDMDAGETTPPSTLFTSLSTQSTPSTQFSSIAQPQVPQLNTNMMQSHQAYRNSTPSTPTMNRNSAAFQGANISSTLNPNPMQQFQDLHNPYRDTPDSSAPGTPGELDESIMAEPLAVMAKELTTLGCAR